MLDLAGTILIVGIVVIGLAVWFGAFARALNRRPALRGIMLLSSWATFAWLIVFPAHLVDILIHPALPERVAEGLDWLVAGILFLGATASLFGWPRWALPGWCNRSDADRGRPDEAVRDR